jgi:hypothetical protein
MAELMFPDTVGGIAVYVYVSNYTITKSWDQTTLNANNKPFYTYQMMLSGTCLAEPVDLLHYSEDATAITWKGYTGYITSMTATCDTSCAPLWKVSATIACFPSTSNSSENAVSKASVTINWTLGFPGMAYVTIKDTEWARGDYKEIWMDSHRIFAGYVVEANQWTDDSPTGTTWTTAILQDATYKTTEAVI